MLGLPLNMALEQYRREGLAEPRIEWTAPPPRRDGVSAPEMGEGRVVALRQNGRTLVCARFLTAQPTTKGNGED